MTTKRRRLTDLYVRGRALSPTDGEGDPVKVWLAKLNEIDRESALRRANAAKARFLIDADNEDGEVFASAYAEIREIDDRDDLIVFLIADDVGKARRRIEAEMALNEETWGKDDYLQGLIDSWYGDSEQPGLDKVRDEDPDDPEAKRVWAEIERYQEEVVADVKLVTEAFKKDWQDEPIDKIRRAGAHRLLELRAAEVFAREFKRQQLFFAVRDPVNRRNRYFENVAELDDLDDELRRHLGEQYEGLMVDRTEGKDLPPAAVSSTLSDSADPDSGPEDASA